MGGGEKIENLELQPREDELLIQGHSMCPGCGVALSVRHILNILGKNTVALFTPGCLSAAAGGEDKFLLRVPAVHMGLVHAASIASGVKAGLDKAGLKDTIVAPLAGDGATADIGFQALSALAERNDDVLYFCIDNESYANTGVQGSGTTPLGASTTTTPVGSRAPLGKGERKKDLFKIMTDHIAPYAATATPGYLKDFKTKVEKAKEIEGFRFIHVLAPCVPGWGFPMEKTVEMSQLAVKSGMFILAESEDGETRITKKVSSRTPVKEYLQGQNRFNHLDDEAIDKIQKEADRNWEAYSKYIEE